MEPENNSEVANSDYLKLDLKLLLITIKRRLVFIALFALAAFTVSAVVAKVALKSSWTARCMLFRFPENTTVDKELPQARMPVSMNTVVETIRTRRNIEQVIKRLNLDISVGAFYQMTSVERDEQFEDKSIIYIAATDSDPAKAAAIANALADVFLADYMRLQNSSAQKIYDYYQTSAADIRAKIMALDKEIKDYLRQNNVISIKIQEASSFKRLSELEFKLLESRMLKDALNIRLEDMVPALKELKKEILLSYTVSASDELALEKLTSTLFELRQRFTDENPKVIKVQQEIDFLRKKLNSKKDSTPVPDKSTYGNNEIRRSMEAEQFKAQSDLKAVERNIAEYEATIATVKQSLTQLSAIDEKYVEMKSRRDVNQEMLRKIDAILTSAKIAIASSVCDIEIMERAVAPPGPNPSKRKLIALAGGVFGLLFALLLVVAIETMDFSVKSQFDFDNVFEIKMAGQVPDGDTMSPNALFSALNVILERIRRLTENVQNPVIVFGSDHANVGKTFIINHFVDTLTARGKKVLYIDTIEEVPDDIKDCVINKYLYEGKSDFDLRFNPINAHLSKAYFHLDEIACRHSVEERDLIWFFERLKDFDYVFWELFDFQKNVLLFAAIAEASDLAVLVAKFRRSNRFNFNNSIKFMKESGCENIVGVLNAVDKGYYEVN